MITRRAFLIGSAATITLSLVDKFYTFIENHGEPLIQAPKNPSGVLYVYPDRDELCPNLVFDDLKRSGVSG